MLGSASRLINRAMGGHRDQSLCARVAVQFGPRCLFCRCIGWLLRDPGHCKSELDWWLFK